MVNRIGEPGDREFKFPLACLNIFGVFRIPGLDPITYVLMSAESTRVQPLKSLTVQGNPYLASLGRLELFPIDLDSCTMGNEQVVSCQPRFGAAIAD
jgi:hypothetical protein